MRSLRRASQSNGHMDLSFGAIRLSGEENLYVIESINIILVDGHQRYDVQCMYGG